MTTLVLLLALPGAAHAADPTRDAGGRDRFLAGDDVRLNEQVAGDAFVAGGRSIVAGQVAGDTVVTGGTVDVTGDVGQNLYAAGGNVRVEARVHGNARIAGGSVTLAPGADIAGNATLAGASVAADGRVGGDLRAFGGGVHINGEVVGDAEVASDDIRIGPAARIGGRLYYRGPRVPSVADGAVIVGGIERRHEPWRGFGFTTSGGRVVAGIVRSLWFTGVLLLGVVLVALFPVFTREAAATAREDALASVGLGFALLVAVPIMALLLFITIIGIPLALTVLLGYGMLVMVGYVVAALAVGDLALAKLKPAEAGTPAWRILFLLLALIAIALVRHAPWIGGLAVFVLFLAGLGAFALRSMRRYKA